ncbi:response regulator, partial [Myxococcota bacterium]|nr:response regulator [Myxococcota bacterium]
IHPATYQFFLGAIVDEDQVLVEEAIDAAVDSKDPNYHYKVEHRIQRPNGEIRHVQETGSVVYDEKGKPIQMIGAVLDITAVKESEIELRVAKENAQDADTAKSQFLASMSHELRTPMNAILGFAQLLELDDSLDKNNLDSVREILKGGDHLLSLINEVLELSRIEAGTTDLLLETVVLSPVINECLDLMRPLAEQRDIRINYSGLDGVAVRADRTRIKQVLLNLLSNAVKYNNEGGSVKIGVQKEEGDQVRLWVQDTGPGIQEELLPYVFAPFNRLGAENSEIEGTGIGLTITQKIVTLMGGSLGVDSHVGQGSVFWIELPNESLPEALHESQYESKYVPSKSDVPDNHIEAQKQTVLYIEDNPANLRLVANIISRRKLKPIHLLTADTPEEGIELALSHRPKLILLDINMPGMDGYQVLEILRADATFESIPIVAVSASAMTRDIERGKAAGFDDYLTKPLNIHHFYEVIDQLLG